ncbi:nuclear transport factor 2 family protein [Sediminibacterium roseum]|uniref:Nuclear transport factor 2 family protein n=1 Tax=Sediminibacterium roseum TaxID=1978412 RepID=A0ABW9ZQ81_9BACT|nr:nuclear transport factor 2 family protein [Sediminibacterium roseum]NCI48637.1 nuclear transport factor 2 family protein [Sediminibacterium roseum]
MKTILTVLSVFLCLALNAQNKDEQAIRNTLAQQTVEWNKGNIDAFMKGYWNNDSLMFVGKSGVTYGYKRTLENYKKNYPDAANMGRLTFNILKVQPIAADTYFVLGKWALARQVGDVSGHYTLLFKKINGKWLIVVDHSS